MGKYRRLTRADNFVSRQNCTSITEASIVSGSGTFQVQIRVEKKIYIYIYITQGQGRILIPSKTGPRTAMRRRAAGSASSSPHLNAGWSLTSSCFEPCSRCASEDGKDAIDDKASPETALGSNKYLHLIDTMQYTSHEHGSYPFGVHCQKRKSTLNTLQ